MRMDIGTMRLTEKDELGRSNKKRRKKKNRETRNLRVARPRSRETKQRRLGGKETETTDK